MSGLHSYSCLPVATLLGWGLIAPAFGQSAATEGGRLEEVVVTAQKRAENLQNVPLTISAYSGEELANVGVDSTQNLQTVTPSLIVNNTSSFYQPFIRGVGTRVTTSGLESSVALYVDDRYVARGSIGIMDLTDVERVEVLQGPQGTLFGRNAAGGAIRVVTKPVSDKLEGGVSGTLGNYDAWGVSGWVNVPVTDTFAARLSATTKQRDGFAKNLVPTGLKQWDSKDFDAVRGKFRWQMSDRVTSELSLSYWEKHDTSGITFIALEPLAYNVGIFRGGISGTKRGEVATAIRDHVDADEFASTLRFDVSGEVVDFASISTFAKVHSKFPSDTEGTSLVVFDTLSREKEESYSQEFQLVSHEMGNWEWLLGAYFYYADSEFSSTLNTGGPVLLSPGLQKIDTTAFAGFGQATYAFTDRWSLTVGGRWSKEKKEVDVTANPRAGVQVSPVPFSDDKSWDEITPNVTLKYTVGDKMTYLTYSKGFKSGGYSYTASVSGKALDPEILDMYELGFKGDFLDNTVRLNVAAFFYDYSDLQVSRGVAASGNISTENAADSEIKGLDAQVTWQALQDLQLMAGLSLLDGKYKSYPDATAFVPNAAPPGLHNEIFDATDKDMLSTPDWAGFVGLEYKPRIGGAELPASLTYSYKDDYDVDFILVPAMKPLRQKGYGLLNGRLSYVPDGASWQVSVWGNNLTDKHYFDDIRPGAFGARGGYGAPRTYGLDVTFNFD